MTKKIQWDRLMAPMPPEEMRALATTLGADTDTALATRLHTHKATVGRWYRGHRTISPHTAALLRLMVALQ